MRARPDPLQSLLVGGDCRSIARSNEALAHLRADQARVVELVRLVHDSDWPVVLRAIDLSERPSVRVGTAFAHYDAGLLREGRRQWHRGLLG